MSDPKHRNALTAAARVALYPIIGLGTMLLVAGAIGIVPLAILGIFALAIMFEWARWLVVGLLLLVVVVIFGVVGEAVWSKRL